VGRNLDPWGFAPFHEQPSFPSIASHRDAYPTACPGEVLYGDLGDIRDAVVELLAYTSPDPEPSPAEFAIGDTVEVVVQDAAQRAGPGTDFTRLRRLNVGDRFTVIDGPVANGGFVWYNLDGARGVGWVASEMLEEAEGGPPPEFVEGDQVVVNTDILNMRASPGLDGSIITQLYQGDQGTVLDGPVADDGYDWYRLQTSRGTGWCASDFLRKTGGPQPQGLAVGATVTVDTDLLNLRDAPSLDGDVIAVLAFGTRLTITGASESADGYTWYPVSSATQGDGWCAGSFLSPTSAPAEEPFAPGDRVRVFDGELNLRESAGLSATVLAVLPDGRLLDVIAGPIETDGYTWYEVTDEDFGAGWCAGEYLELA
jgi:uncharacterized protein YgiM (DUF1202 family)